MKVVVYTPAENFFYNTDAGANIAAAIFLLVMAGLLAGFCGEMFRGKYRSWGTESTIAAFIAFSLFAAIGIKLLFF